MIYDISMNIYYGMPVYKNRADKQPIIKTVRDYTSDSIYESRIDMDLHTGTHLDAPLHVFKGGSTVDNIELRKVITRCRVLDLTGISEKITKAELANKVIKKGDFVLLKTGNSHGNRNSDDFIFLDDSGAEYLKNLEVTGVGIDAPGIERDQPGHSTHKLLLECGIMILEGLRLPEVPEGEYLLFAVPLNIIGAEASPVRALLMDNEALINW